MANEIKLKIRVEDDGSLTIVTKQAKQAAQALNQAATSTSNLSKAKGGLHVRQNAYNKLEKGTAQLTANSTKAFSKQAQTLGGTLVPAYATLAANIFALTAALGALRRAAAFEQLQQGLVMVGAAAGKNLPFVAAQLRAITGEAVSAQAAMSAVALGTASGFSTQQLTELTKVAKGASLALGRDMEDALSRLVRGTAKVEPEILDELGIMVRLDRAVQDYATSLGKNANALTQFERSQAFLNATIEEGLTKFSFVAEAVDANPYDKLAAAFNNLQKSAFRYINMVLTPLVDLLNSEPTALLGVLIMFGSTIVSKIVPAVTELANKQKLLAKITALEATKAAKIQSQAYTNSLAKVAAAWNVVPKSVEKIKDPLLQGKATAQQYELAIKRLQVSEKLRDNNLKNYHGNVLVQKKEELALVRSLKAEIEKLQIAERNRFTTGAAGSKARSQSLMAQRQAQALEKVGAAGAIGGFKEAVKGVQRQLYILGKTSTTTWNTIRLGATLAANAARLFGTALLSAIPIIGQLVFAWGLLSTAYHALFKESQIKKTVNEVVDSFKSFDKAAEQLAITLSNPLLTASEQIIASLRVEVGLLEQVAAGLDLVQQKRREENLEKRIKLARQLFEATKRYNQYEGLPEEGIDVSAKQVAYERMLLAQRKLLEAQQDLSNIDIGSGLKVIEGALDSLRAVGEVGSEGFQRAQNSLIALMNELFAAEKAGEQITEKYIRQRVTQILEEAGQVQVKALNNVQGAIQNYQKEVNKLVNKQVTPYDNMLKAFDSFVNEYRGILTGPETRAAQDVFIKENEEMVELITKFYAAQKGISLDAANVVPVIERSEYFGEILNKNRQTLIDSKGRMEQLALAQKSLNSIANESPLAMQRMLELQRGVLQEKINQLVADDAILAQSGAEIKHTEEILALQQELNRNRATNDAKIQQARVTLAKKVFEYEKKLVEENIKMRDLIEETATLRLQSALSAANADISAASAYKLVLDFEGQRLQKIEEQAKLRKDSIELEYQLLVAKTKLERATAQQAVAAGGLDPGAIAQYDHILELLEWSKQASLDAAEAETERNKAAEDALKLEKERLAVNEAFKLSQELILNKATEASITTSKTLSTQYELTAITMERQKVYEELSKMEDGMPEKLLKQLEYQKLLTEELKKQVELSQAKTDDATRLGGGIFGAANQFGTNLTAAAPQFDSDQVGIGEKLKLFNQSFYEMSEQLRMLGPEGEVASAAIQGALNMTEAWGMAFQTIKEQGISSFEGVKSVLVGLASTVSALGALQQANSNAAVSAIDKEIEAEKRRDGSSAKSVAKINALEKKKEAIKRKAFEQDKKMKMASVVMATAVAIMESAKMGLPWSIPFIAMAAALGAAQLAVISGSTYDGGGVGDAATGPTSIAIGERGNAVDLAKSRSPSGELAYLRGERGMGDTGANNYVPIPSFTGRATGGNTAFMVGEQGPELFIPDRPGTIIPADETENVGGQLNVNFSINTIDTQGMQDALVKQRGNIIGMIREAANSRGEFFLENINIREDDAL